MKGEPWDAVTEGDWVEEGSKILVIEASAPVAEDPVAGEPTEPAPGPELPFAKTMVISAVSARRAASSASSAARSSGVSG